MDTSLPSPQVAGLLNKANFPSCQHLSLEYWLSSREQPDPSLLTPTRAVRAPTCEFRGHSPVHRKTSRLLFLCHITLSLPDTVLCSLACPSVTPAGSEHRLGHGDTSKCQLRSEGWSPSSCTDHRSGGHCGESWALGTLVSGCLKRGRGLGWTTRQKGLARWRVNTLQTLYQVVDSPVAGNPSSLAEAMCARAEAAGQAPWPVSLGPQRPPTRPAPHFCTPSHHGLTSARDSLRACGLHHSHLPETRTFRAPVSHPGSPGASISPW